MNAEQVVEWVETHEMKPCPFCGGKLEWHDESYVNIYGKTIRQLYFMHDDTKCILNDICMPFTLGCGNSVEYAEAWNKRVM